MSEAEAPVVERPRRRGGRRLATTSAALVGLGVLLLGAAVTIDSLQGTPDPGASPVAEELGTPLVSARRTPEWTTELMGNRAVAAAMDPIAATAPPNTCIGVGNGTSTIYAHNTNSPLVPASNQKLLTAAAALDILGDDATLNTSLVTVAAPAGGVLAGDLYLVGSGDPLLMTDGYQQRFERGRLPETDLEAIADELVAGGLNQINGSVVGDGNRYDAARTVAGWPERWLTDGTVAPLSALTVNDAWLIDPTTGSGPGGPALDPPAHAAGVLSQLLTERGVVIAGPPLSGPAPDGASELLGAPSLPVSDLVDQLLTYSDNTTAELLLKEIGLVAGGEGSTAAGTAALTLWATEQGLLTDGVVVGDGSGLSSSNQLTCELLAMVLRSGGSDGTLAAGLAVPGQAGTLYDRFPGDERAMRLRAKTGTLAASTALSGWLITRPGATLDFQIVTNTDGRSVTSDDIAIQSRVIDALLDQPLAPPIEQAGPLPLTGG